MDALHLGAAEQEVEGKHQEEGQQVSLVSTSELAFLSQDRHY